MNFIKKNNKKIILLLVSVILIFLITRLLFIKESVNLSKYEEANLITPTPLVEINDLKMTKKCDFATYGIRMDVPSSWTCEESIDQEQFCKFSIESSDKKIKMCFASHAEGNCYSNSCHYEDFYIADDIEIRANYNNSTGQISDMYGKIGNLALEISIYSNEYFSGNETELIEKIFRSIKVTSKNDVKSNVNYSNPGSLEVINEYPGPEGVPNIYYMSDGLHVYYYRGLDDPINPIRIEDADLNSFQNIDREYSTDKDSVFFGSNKIKNITPEQFINKELTLVFEPGGSFNSPPVAATPIGGSFSKVDGKIYTVNTLVEGINVNSSYEVVSDEYLYSENNVYYRCCKINEVDFETFEVIDGVYSKDKNNVYSYGKIHSQHPDVDSFEVILPSYRYYTKDKNNVYYIEYIVKDADIDTFEVVEISENGRVNIVARDKNGIFKGATRVD